MTYGENKKIFFSLIDEYQPTNPVFTEDEDAKTKCARLYDVRYFELATYRSDKKVKEYQITSGRGYEKFKLPSGTNIKPLGRKKRI